MKKAVNALRTDTVSRNEIRDKADAIASSWVEDLRSPLEHRFKISPTTIAEMAEWMKRLHILSRPNNLKSSYLDLLSDVLKDFEDKFVLPIKQMATNVESILDLTKLVPNLPDPDESSYLREAIECAAAGHYRASIVLGWCCVIDRFQRKIQALGFDAFNRKSTSLKNQTSGKFKRWKKEFNIMTLSELQEVFDGDLIVVLEGMELLDGNQAERLSTCFQYRCHSAHPGQAPINDVHVVAFFNDITEIVLQNVKFKI